MARETAGWTTRGLAWERRQSMYFLLFLTGVLYWVPLVYTGLRVTQPRWVLHGAFYGIPAFAGYAFGIDSPEDWLARFAYAAYFAALLHTWLARGEFLARLDLLESDRMESIESARSGGGFEPGSHGAEIRDIIKRHKSQKSRGTRKLPDLNAMTERDFALLPGFGPELARRAIQVRGRVRLFISFGHFAQEMALDEEAYAALRPIFEGEEALEMDPDVAAAMKEAMVYSVSEPVDFGSAAASAAPPSTIEWESTPVPAQATGPRRLDAGRSIELNAASEDALSLLPGIGPEKARQAVASRAEAGPFRSMEDFGARLALPEPVLARIREHASVAPPARPGKGSGGRVVDA